MAGVLRCPLCSHHPMPRGMGGLAQVASASRLVAMPGAVLPLLQLSRLERPICWHSGKPLAQRIERQSKFFRPQGKRQNHPVKLNDPVAPLVQQLLTYSDPATVLWRVAFFVVDPVKRKSLSMASRKRPRLEGITALPPFIANRDSSAAVVFEAGVLWVIAAAKHVFVSQPDFLQISFQPSPLACASCGQPSRLLHLRCLKAGRRPTSRSQRCRGSSPHSPGRR